MKKKIFWSIMLTSGAVLIIGFIVTLGCLYDTFGGIEEQQIEDALTLAAQGVESNGQVYLAGLAPSRYRLTWVSADGDVLYDTQAEQSGMENHSDRVEIQAAFESGEGVSIRYSATLLERTIYYARHLDDGTVLRVSVRHAAVGALVLGILPSILLILVLALTLSGVLAARVTQRVMEPLEHLNLEAPLDNDVYDELSPLLTRINQQRRRIERQTRTLQRKSDEFTQITQSMAEGLVLLNRDGVILNINPAAERIFHTDSSCMEHDFLIIERSPEVSHALRAALRDGHSALRIARDGKEYQLAISRIESDGVVIGAALLVFDVTEHMYAERNRREFTANVSHELKTPLQSIMGSAELIENGMVKEEDLSRFAGRIRAEAGRLVTLIDDMIRLSQLDEGGELIVEEVDLTSEVKEAAEVFQNTAAAKHIALTVTGEPVRFPSVRRLVCEIVWNLCDNAIKYNVDGGSVELSVSRNEQGARLTVKDTGIGIPLDAQTRVFERFYRVDKSRSRESGGTGLGLSIVKHAVQYLHGEIALESVLGQGTTIQVTFPLPYS